jgi:anti-anti-sigma regulatory factor
VGRFREGRLSVRAHQWGHFVVLTLQGEFDGRGRDKLKDSVLWVQSGQPRGGQPVLLDLWDLPRCDLAGIAAVRDVQELLESRGWAFAVVADPSGPWPKALDPIATYPDRRAARSALYHAAP